MSASVSADAQDPIGDPPLSAQERAEAATARAEAATREMLGHILRAVLAVYHTVRGVMFLLYLVLGLLSFWLWATILVCGVLLLALRAAMLLFLWLSGGIPPHERAESWSAAVQRDLKRLWAHRLVAYEAFARPAARDFLRLQRGLQTFWFWPFHRKVIATVAMFFFIVIPSTYLVPRPHYIQITDDNAIHYTEGGGGKVKYLVHGLDLFKPGVHREYMNEDAWWLGKVNAQGLKSQLQIGRNYRLWVVGLRWYFAPQLFPNIISAAEVNEHGETLEHPTSRIATPIGAGAPQRVNVP